jgi:uncharacterized membrane protein YjgN (DUF898 family)
MENEKSIFNLELDAIAKNHLTDTVKWARFLAILGFIGLGLILITSIFVSINSANRNPDYIDDTAYKSGQVAGSMFVALLIIAIYFFPFYFLWKFANKMKVALLTDDSASLNEALKNLKATFRYVGVLTIIFIALTLIGMIANLSGS